MTAVITLMLMVGVLLHYRKTERAARVGLWALGVALALFVLGGHP